MHLRPYLSEDWSRVRDIHDLCKPDEMRGSVDLSAILLLEQDPPTLEMFRRSEIIVIEDASEVVGFTAHMESYISWLCVHPSHRRRGIATLLLQEVLGRIEGIATLNVGKHNLPARSLYERFGFVIERDFIGTFNGRRVEVLKMQRPLGNAICP